MKSTSSQWVGSCGGVNLPFNRRSTAYSDLHSRRWTITKDENIVELRACRAILSGCPGCEYVHSSSRSPGKITDITRGGFLSGISCLNNTSIVMFFPTRKQRGLEAEQKYFQGFQNLFFMSSMALRENCYGGPVHFSRTQMLKLLLEASG